MKMVEYLKENCREPVPEWLLAYKPGQPLPLRQFLQSRTGFYPGAGNDGQLFRVFGKSHSVHCFILVDYMVSEEAVQESIHRPAGIRGYEIIDERSVSEQEMMSAASFRKWHITEAERQHGRLGTVAPFARFVVLERCPSLGDEHGGERLAVLFLGADAIATYDAIYANKNAEPPFVCIVEDWGLGGQWARFTSGGLLEKISERSCVHPEFLLTSSKPWAGYEGVDDVKGDMSGVCRNLRILYHRKVLA